MTKMAWIALLLGACSGNDKDEDTDATVDADADTDADADADSDADTDTSTGDTATTPDVAGAEGVWQGVCIFTYKTKDVEYIMDMALLDDGTGDLDGFGVLEVVLPASKKKKKKYSYQPVFPFVLEGTFDGVDSVDLDVTLSIGQTLPFTGLIDGDDMDGFLWVTKGYAKKKKKKKKTTPPKKGLDCVLARSL